MESVNLVGNMSVTAMLQIVFLAIFVTVQTRFQDPVLAYKRRYIGTISSTGSYIANSI